MGMLGRFAVRDPLITFAIAVRNDSRGLWFTIHNILLNMLNTPYEGKVKIAVVNNSDNINDRAYIRTTCQRMSYFIDYKEINDRFSNHLARNEAVRLAQTEFVVLCDSHVLFQKNFLEETISVLTEYPQAGLVHCPMSTMGISDVSRLACFYSLARWNVNFHGSYSHYNADWEKPFPVALAGHGAVVFRRQQWLDFGGYMDICDGHGGGEPFVTYKYWLFGYKAYCTPHTVYAHWRTSSYHKSRGLWLRNMVYTAYGLWGKEVGDDYASRLRHGHMKNEIWAQTKGYNDFVEKKKQLQSLTCANFLDYLKDNHARPYA